MLLKYDIRDIVVTDPMFGGHQYVILEITNTKSPEYRAINTDNRKTYKIAQVQIVEKVGQVPEDSPWIKDPDVFYDVSAGKEYAEKMAYTTEAEGDRERWLALSTLNPGDHIKVVHRHNIVRVEFKRVNIGKPRFAFAACMNEKVWNFPLNSIYLT